MLTLHEAIREIQKELQISSEERIQAGDEPCFITDKLTIELTCTFSEKKSSKSNAGLDILSVLTVDSGKDKDISTDFIHKITLEFKTVSSSFSTSGYGAGYGAGDNVGSSVDKDGKDGADGRNKGFVALDGSIASAILPSDEE